MISSMISVQMSIHLPKSFSSTFRLQHTFQGYNSDRTTSDTGGVADEQKVRTAGLAEVSLVRGPTTLWSGQEGHAQVV